MHLRVFTSRPAILAARNCGVAAGNRGGRHAEYRDDAQQVQLVKESFAKIAPIAEQAADLFYGRLFDIAPQLRPLFNGDIKAQGRKLMSTISSRSSATAIRLVILSCNANKSLASPSHLSAQRCTSSAASINCALTRTRLADRWTLPSSRRREPPLAGV